MVKWRANLSNGETINGMSDDGSWSKLQDLVITKQVNVIHVEVYNDIGGGDIDRNCSGYFLCNKSIGFLYGAESINLVGLGYWRKHENVVRIKWFNTRDMGLSYTEARPIEQCGAALIKNIA